MGLYLLARVYPSCNWGLMMEKLENEKEYMYHAILDQ